MEVKTFEHETMESVSLLELKKILDLHLVHGSVSGLETINGITTETKTVDISPALAEWLLVRNTNNRPLDKATVFKLTKAMTNGEWNFDPNAITFDKYGKLLDGQHRLTAIVKSGKTYPFRVSYGFPPEIFSTMDIGKIRTGGDILAIAGYNNSKLYSLTANFIYRFYRGVTSEVGGYSANQSANLTHIELLKFVQVKPEIKESIEFYMKIKSKLHGASLVPSNVITGLHFLFSEKDKEMSEIFLKKLLIGEGLITGSPILVVRNRLLSAKFDRNKNITQTDAVKLIINGWNKFRENKSVKQINIPDSIPIIL